MLWPNIPKGIGDLERVSYVAVTVIWASLRFGHPHSQTLVIWASPFTLTLTLTQITNMKRECHITVTSLLRHYKPQGILVPRASWGPGQENGTGYTFLAQTFLGLFR